MRNGFRAGLAAALLLLPGAAAAQWQIGAEVEAAFQDDGVPSHDIGLGFAGRLGYTLPLLPFDLAPEIRVGYIDFGGPTESPSAMPGTVDMLRVTGGARLSFGTFLRPVLFAHVGWGDLAIDIDEREKAGDVEGSMRGWSDTHRTATTWDVGAGLGVRLLSMIDLGVHLAYNRLGGDADVSWVSAGVLAGLRL